MPGVIGQLNLPGHCFKGDGILFVLTFASVLLPVG
jgi:hypothetical protein